MMRYSSTAHKLADEATVTRLRTVLLRITASCDALREQTSAPSRDFASLMKRLSQEIDESVLPRKFALFSDTGMEATFVVSNRRLIELEIGERKVEFDVAAHTDADTVARICAKALRALCLRTGPLRLRPIGRAFKVTTHSSTCTARHIAEFSSASSLENRLKAFLKASHARSLGWIYRSGADQTVTHDPDEKILEKLHSLQKALMSQGYDQGSLSRVERAGPTCSAFALTADAQVLIAEDGKERLLAAFPSSEITAAVSKWHQAYKRSES